MNTPSHMPTIHLVGAGPGDPDLLTLAGAKALANAAVIIYDALANPALLSLAPPAAEKIYVGKSAGAHTLTQDQINQLLVTKAHELAAQIGNGQSAIRNASIVRLKGGDPFVFGRGGEEAQFLRAHNIPFTVIPGITAGIAAPAYAGIPVTHRDFSTSVTLITAHEKEETPELSTQSSALRTPYSALAALLHAGGTLVFYMSVKSLPNLTQKLLAENAHPDTPAALIRWGTRPDQQSLTTTLANLPTAAASIKPPAITILGKVVSLRDELNWFEQRPLFGQTILVTRARDQASSLAAGLAALGARVLEAPTIEIHPPADEDLPAIDDALLHLPAYDWILFTSPNAVHHSWQRLQHLDFDARHFAASDIASIGPATTEALAKIGLTPNLQSPRNTSEDLARALLQKIGNGQSEIGNQRILLLRTNIAPTTLPDTLRAAGAQITDLPIYRTFPPKSLPPEILAALENNEITWTTFTSASTAANLWNLLPENLRQKIALTNRASIGPSTTTALQTLSPTWTPTTQSPTPSIPALIDAILTATHNAHP
ncbi:MAG TPA: uroporphyrinogen-III C-methyltransferase [Phycisphaerae bacterium]|nr:uroporphyrinogen-III C-methyltransferase [Phycisphaerae bacterium]